MITLTDTNSAAISAEFVRARTAAGSPAMGMVMTLIVVTDDDQAEAALDAARQASLAHPARVLGLVVGSARGKASVDADVTVGAGWGGEMAHIHLAGEVAKYPESVVLPLLLPDSPVVVWWPTDAPDDPASDRLGALAGRRITDAASSRRALDVQCHSYAPGNTDLAWTRLTPWRALLAAALDQHPAKVIAGEVSAERGNPSAQLLAAWLSHCLKVEISLSTSDGPGITEVRLETKTGDVAITRPDGVLATFTSPGHPDRPIALKRRSVPELLLEELRRLDEDEIYAGTVRSIRRAHKAPQKGAQK